MKRKHLVFLGLVVFMVVIGLSAKVFNVASSADETCRQVMMSKNGHGPWHPLSAPADENVNIFFFASTTRSYSDGVNTATCSVQRLGPVWYASGGFGQTFAGYDFGLDPACRGLPYPVRAYGVLPAEVESEQEIQQEFLAFAKTVYTEVCQVPSSVSQ